MYNPFTNEETSNDGRIINIGFSRPENECLRHVITEFISSKGTSLYEQYCTMVNNLLTEEEKTVFFEVLVSSDNNFRLMEQPADLAILKEIYKKLPLIKDKMESVYLNYCE